MDGFKKIAKDLEEISQKNAIVNDGDYYTEDGMLHCGKCHRAKQVKVISMGREYLFGSTCDCRIKELEEEKRAEEEKNEQRKRNERISRLKAISLMDEKLKHITFDDFKQTEDNKNLYDTAKKYLEVIKKKQNVGLLFYGDVGTGKTYTCACIANELIENNYQVVMTSISKILMMKIEEQNELILEVAKADVIILDDLGVERKTEYAQEKVYGIIDNVYNANKSLILSTNQNMDQLKKNNTIEMQRIYDRIFEMCIPIKCIGTSKRLQSARLNYNEFMNM